VTRRLLPLALLAAAACNTDLSPQYRVLDLRILAVRAEVEGDIHADVVPGETLRLEALVANPLGRAVEVRWLACAPTGTDAVPACVDEEFLKDPLAYAARPDSGVVLIGEGAAPAPIPVLDVEEAVEAAIRLAESEPTFQCRLFAEIPVVVVAEADGRREVALKRVRLTPDPADLAPPLADVYVRNENPRISDMRRGRTEGEACTQETPVANPFPAAQTFLCGLPTAGSTQRYRLCGPDGPLRPPPAEPDEPESLSWQWYVTDGEFLDVGPVGNATGGTSEFRRPPGPFALWGILRDGRGGEAWVRRDIAGLP
jgi:hypothetical protein